MATSHLPQVYLLVANVPGDKRRLLAFDEYDTVMDAVKAIGEEYPQVVLKEDLPIFMFHDAEEAKAFVGHAIHGTLPDASREVRPRDAFRAGSKAEQVIEMMSRKRGASLQEVIDAQGVSEGAARTYLTTYPRKIGRGYRRDDKGRYHIV